MNLIKKITLVCFLAIAAIACSNDDDNGSSKKNEFTYDGTSYELSLGYLEDFGEFSEGVYNFDIYLLSSNAENGMYFEMFTDNQNKLEVGTYTLSNSGNANTFSSSSEIGINLNSENEKYYEITEGTVEILSNDTYKIEFEGTANGKAFSGYYKGSLNSGDILPRPARK
ncbi:hypothetical protein [Mesonia sp. K7]|uniref:hypothetical protein n=1 Tax=Mesonia sp. K7 TaxID=2218606 RepID=UPI000DAA3DA5|nr:hypothetical protein [Mesonia sp. K7]PZD79001.1 hypothetical protein DNG35_03065 [Mesonia sp. K7]